jgi:hypothetical protein
VPVPRLSVPAKGWLNAADSLKHYCTYFDQNYLLKGLALSRSLRRHAGPCVLWVLCLDECTFDTLQALAEPDVRLIRLETLEAWEPRLLAAKGNRSRVEYYWTCTPSLIAYVLAQQAAGETVGYVDADLYFFGSPEPLYQELDGHAIGIHEHRYAPEYRQFAEDSGTYNVGLTLFRADDRGWQGLRWWQAACLDACSILPTATVFGDQKYLDDWPARFEGVRVLEHLGAGLAPWNATNYRYEWVEGGLTVDGAPLIFYHFHNLRQLTPWVSAQREYHVPKILRNRLYEPYLVCLRENLRRVRKVRPGFRAGFKWMHPRRLLADAIRGRLVWS